MALLIRKSATTAAAWDPTMLAYARAVFEMRRRDQAAPPGNPDPTGWSFQAAMHGTYQPSQPQWHWNGCQHASWFFLPWHRMYIWYFEQIVRSIVVATGGPADWALPYWDWTTHRAIPWAFRQPTVPPGTLPGGNSANPLFTTRRNAKPAPGINGGALLPAPVTSVAYALSFTGFSSPRQTSPVTGESDPGFGGGPIPAPKQFQNPPLTGGLEDQPHNVVHDLVGGRAVGHCGAGWMSDPLCAAQDPIFWLHHSNIDRVWVEWLALGGTRLNPSSQPWLTQQFSFFDAQGKPASLKISGVLHTTQLNYRYDRPPLVARPVRAVAAVAAAAPEPEEAAEAEGATIAEVSAVQLTTEPVSVPLTLDAQTNEAVRTLPADTGPNELYLVLDDIQVNEHPGYVYGIYLNAGKEPEDPSQHRVGFLSFFGLSHHGEGHEHPPARRSFRITSLAYDLQDRGEWDESALEVTFRPVGLETADGTEAAAVDLVADDGAPDVVIGSVKIVAM